MKNLKLTIAEAQEMLLMSQSSVYSWIDKGKLQAIESPSGKLILISDNEANEIREMNLKSKRNKTSKFSGVQNDIGINSTNDDLEEPVNSGYGTSEKVDKNLTEKLITELKELALEAGKYKQLEIIRNEEKENYKYWEEKYFQINSELMQKNTEIAELKIKISDLEKKLEKYEKKGFFGNLFSSK